jgi:hypothetical protein
MLTLAMHVALPSIGRLIANAQQLHTQTADNTLTNRSRT